jgi:two-component system NtrC family sensor kinase
LSLPTILITAEGSEKVAVEAFRLGVQDYLPKPIDPELLAQTIARSLSQSRLRREKEFLTAQLKDQVALQIVLSRVGRSVTSSLNLDEVLRRIVEASVLLTHAEEGFLALLDEGSGQLYLRAVKNITKTRSPSACR